MAKIILNLDVSIGYLGVIVPLYLIHKRLSKFFGGRELKS